MQVREAAQEAAVLLCCSLEKRPGICDLGSTNLKYLCLQASVMPLLASQLEPSCLEGRRTRVLAPLTDVRFYIPWPSSKNAMQDYSELRCCGRSACSEVDCCRWASSVMEHNSACRTSWHVGKGGVVSIQKACGFHSMLLERLSFSALRTSLKMAAAACWLC